MDPVSESRQSVDPFIIPLPVHASVNQVVQDVSKIVYETQTDLIRSSVNIYLSSSSEKQSSQ